MRLNYYLNPGPIGKARRINSYQLSGAAWLGCRSRSRVFLVPWSRSRLKKTGAGAAWKKSRSRSR